MTDSAENNDDEISLLDLLVTIAENWVFLVAGPLLVGAAAFAFLYFQPQPWRTSATLDLSPVEITAKLPMMLEGAPPPSGLSIAEIGNGLSIIGDGASAPSRLELVLDTKSAAQAGLAFLLDQLVAAVERDALPSSAETAQVKREALEQEVVLREGIIQRLTEALEAISSAEDFDAASYAQMASTHNELMLARDFKLGELEELLDAPAATALPLVIETEEPSRIGRSPIIITLLAVLGTGFVLLVLVFIRAGLKNAAQNSESRQKINRIRRAFGLKPLVAK